MSKILVTGASGKLGGLVIDNLIAKQGVAPADIVAGTRDPSKLSALVAKGVEARKVDFDDPASLEAAFKGIDRLLIVSTDELATPGKRLVQHKAAVEAAKKAGVGRLFYTSLPNADISKVTFAPDHLGTEEAIKATGLPYTLFRNSWYMENLFMALPAALGTGQWYTSSGQGRIGHISRGDIAKAIAGALAKPASESITYTLTGEKTYTTDEIAALVREVSGRPLAVVHVTDEQLAAGMAGAGVPAPFIPTFVSFDTNTREGLFDVTNDEAAKLSGEKLVSLKDFLIANKAALSA